MRDPGLQPERTSLSWRRTAFSTLVVNLLLIRDAVHTHQAWGKGMVLVLVGICSLSATISFLRMRRLRTSGVAGAPHAALMAFTTLVVCLAATAGLLLVITASR